MESILYWWPLTNLSCISKCGFTLYLQYQIKISRKNINKLMKMFSFRVYCGITVVNIFPPLSLLSSSPSGWAVALRMCLPLSIHLEERQRRYLHKVYVHQLTCSAMGVYNKKKTIKMVQGLFIHLDGKKL